MVQVGDVRGGGTQRALLLADRTDPHLSLAQRLVQECGWLVDHMSGALDPRDLGRYTNAALIIATPASLARLEPGISLRLLRQTQVVLLVSRHRLLETADYAQLADGFLFYDTPESALCAAVDLACTGHTVCPPYLAPGFTLDSARLEKLEDMSPGELAVLDRLAEGDPNLDIARYLSLQEREVKYLVRSLLTKLHFANRTEAGVFALRFRAAVHEQQRLNVTPNDSRGNDSRGNGESAPHGSDAKAR
mgnify:CR=1 FL=1